MRHKNLIRLAALGLGAALLLSGCSLLAVRTDNPDPSETESESAPAQDTAGDYSKYNAYLKLADELYEMMDILDVYFTNVEYDREFALMEGGDYAAIKDAVDFYIANTYELEQAADYVDKEPAYARADAVVRALGDSPVKLMEAVEDLSGYMQFNDFEEDNLARAPEIHAAIWEPLQICVTYYNELLDAMDELDKLTRDEGLEDLRQDGQMILYHSSVMIYTGQDILDGIWDQYQTAVSQADPEAEFVLPEIDMTGLSPLFERFNTAYEELTAAMGKEEEQEKVFTGPVAESAMKLYSGKVDSCYSYMGALAKALVDGSDYGEAYDNASEAMSSLIGGYNSIN